MSEISLDDLFREARAAVRLAAKQPKQAEPLPLGVYENPANWKPTRGIALIHAETQTLLGNFTEYMHRSVVGARRLVRESPGLPVVATETISGDWHLARETPIAPKRAWHTELNALTSLTLTHLRVCAPDVPVRACFDEGRLVRLELHQRTLFSQLPGAAAALLFLPADTDVLNELAPPAVRALLLQLGQPV